MAGDIEADRAALRRSINVQSLLSEAGLALQRVVPTRGAMSVIEAEVAP
jgi:hypothetical protein